MHVVYVSVCVSCMCVCVSVCLFATLWVILQLVSYRNWVFVLFAKFGFLEQVKLIKIKPENQGFCFKMPCCFCVNFQSDFCQWQLTGLTLKNVVCHSWPNSNSYP